MFFEKISKCIGIVSLLAILGGCGGSTQGTGGITVEGRLLELSGSPVQGASVTLLTSGDSTITDGNGAFVLEAPTTQIELLFESGNTSAATAVSVTPQTRRVAATFKLDRERSRVDTEDLEIEEDDDNRDDDPIDDDSGDDDGGDDDSSDDGDDSSDDNGGDDNGDDNGGDSDGDDDGDSPDDNGGNDDDPDGDDSGSGGSGGGDVRREVRGLLDAISSSEVIVDGVRFSVVSSSEYRDENGAPVNASYFTVGMEVKARGSVVGGALILDRLESEEED